MRLYGLVILGVAVLSGCSGANGAPLSPPDELAAAPAGIEPVEPPAPTSAPRQQTRLTERDFDADGIADYRLVTTEVYDAEGNLVGVTQEQDFDADGVIDARETTNFR